MMNFQHNKRIPLSSELTAFVKNIPKSWTENDIHALFSTCCAISGIKLMVNPQFPLNRAYVNLKSANAQKLIIDKFNGWTDGQGTKIYVEAYQYLTNRPPSSPVTHQMPDLQAERCVTAEGDRGLKVSFPNTPTPSNGRGSALLKAAEVFRTPPRPERGTSLVNNIQGRNQVGRPAVGKGSNGYSAGSPGTSMQHSPNRAPAGHFCGYCGVLTDQYCSQCKSVYYCSSKCQNDDWSFHSQTCARNVTQTSNSSQFEDANINASNKNTIDLNDFDVVVSPEYVDTLKQKIGYRRTSSSTVDSDHSASQASGIMTEDELLLNKPVTVKLLDFVNPSEFYVVPKDQTKGKRKLSKSEECCLLDLNPKEGDVWADETFDLLTQLGLTVGSQCIVTCFKKSDGINHVKIMLRNGTDVGEALLRAGLARLASQPPSETEHVQTPSLDSKSNKQPSSADEDAQPTIHKSPAVQANLTPAPVTKFAVSESLHRKLQPGQSIQLVIDESSIESLQSFYAQVGGRVFFDVLKSFKEMEQQIPNYATHIANKPPAGYKPEVGDYVLAPFCDGWFRGKIENADAINVVVGFIDYGNLETCLHQQILPIPAQFTSLPAIAVQCKLHQVLDKEDEQSQRLAKEQLKALADDNIKAIVREVSHDLLSVDVFNKDGVNISDLLIKYECATSLGAAAAAKNRENSDPQQKNNSNTHYKADKDGSRQEVLEKQVLGNGPQRNTYVTGGGSGSSDAEETFINIGERVSPPTPKVAEAPSYKRFTMRDINRPDFPIGELHTVLVVFAESLQKLYIRHADREELNRLFSLIGAAVEHERFNGPLRDVQPGEVVLAFAEEVQDWDRVVILQPQPNKHLVWKVRSIDHGNEYEVTPEKLRPLTEDLLQPRCSAKITLKGVEGVLSQEGTLLLQSVLNRQVHVKFENEDGNLVCQMYNGDEVINTMLQPHINPAGLQAASVSFEKNSKPDHKRFYLSDAKLSKFDEAVTDALVMGASDLDGIYIRNADRDEMELLTGLKEQHGSSQSASNPPNNIMSGELLFAYARDVDDWDRVVVVTCMSDEIIQVRSVDFGNVYMVEKKDLRVMMPDLIKVPISVKARLHGVDGVLNDEGKALLAELEQKKVSVEVMEYKADELVCQIYLYTPDNVKQNVNQSLLPHTARHSTAMSNGHNTQLAPADRIKQLEQEVAALQVEREQLRNENQRLKHQLNSK